MTITPLFNQRLPVRLTAPTSVFDGHVGEVDAHELDAARRRDHNLTVYFDDGTSTIAFADELEVLGSPGGSCRQEIAARLPGVDHAAR